MGRSLGRLAIACAAGLLACSSGAGDGEPAPQPAAAGEAGMAATVGGAGAPACDARVEVFPVLCGTGVCHDGAINGVDLIAPGVDGRVRDVLAAGVNCGKSGLRLVDSSDPDRSLLLLKLREPAACGSPMPLGSGPSGLTMAQLDCVDSFVRTVAGQ